MTDLDTRLSAATALRDRLQGESQRIAGRKDAAEKALKEVDDEIRSKKLNPDTLDDTLSKLNAAYEKEVVAFEAAVEKAQQALSPYLES